MAMNVTPFQSSDSFNMAGFNNMIAQINSGVDGEIANIPKVVFGSYVGTGLSEEDNPCVLTFDFAPKIVCVSDSNGVLSSAKYGASDLFATIRFVESWPSSFTSGLGFGYSGYSHGCRSTDGKTISWYASGGQDLPALQLNESGKTYYYMAIG